MTELITINHPFQTVDDFQQRAGHKLARLIHRLAGKYPQLSRGCGVGRMLLALSVAWGMTSAARAGNQAVLEHIDEALSPYQRMGYVMEPPGGCIMVEGRPFLLADEEQTVRRFLWDGFAIFIEHEGVGNVSQAFFDLADTHQWKAYTVMGEESREEKHKDTEDLLNEAKRTQEDRTLKEYKKESYAKGTNIHHQSNTDNINGGHCIAHDDNPDIRNIMSRFASRLDLMEECLEQLIIQLNKMEQKMELNQTFNYYAPIGQQIAHVDKIEAHFDKDMGITVDGQSVVPSPSGGVSPDEEWIDEIISCFMGDREKALEFVGMARNMKPKQITDLVNAWLTMKKISSLSCKRDLWKPLHEHGIYECTEQNWNAQVQIP